MLGILLIYFIGRAFYRLVQEYEKNVRVNGVLSVVFFYAVQIVIALLALLINPKLLDNILLNVFAVIFSGATTYFAYQFMQKKLKKNKPSPIEEIHTLGKE